MTRAHRNPTQTQACRVAARLHTDVDPSVPHGAAHSPRLAVASQRALGVLHDAGILLLVALVLFACALSCVGLELEVVAALRWVDTGVYTAPLLGTVLPELQGAVASVLAQLLLSKPWLVPSVHTVLVDWFLDMHVGVAGLLFGIGMLWLYVTVDENHRQATKH